MSIIIKGIDLPEILHTDIRIYKDGSVMKIIGENALLSIPDMRAIQIPKGHGRLGDLGKLAKLILEFEKSVRESIRGDRIMITEGDLNHAIAILTEHFQEYEPLLEEEE